MSTIIFRTIAPYLSALMILFSAFVLLRGHNDPGGGFIGGLIAASALAIYGIAYGPEEVRRAIHMHPTTVAGIGMLLATLAGLVSLPFARPMLTGLWYIADVGGIELPLSTVLMFDIGVYFVVVGSLSSIALTLEESD